jgi:hypothetical protein
VRLEFLPASVITIVPEYRSYLNIGTRVPRDEEPAMPRRWDPKLQQYRTALPRGSSNQAGANIDHQCQHGRIEEEGYHRVEGDEPA